MVPEKDGKANHGHSCVKGRFAWGYANHRDRITTPLVREAIDQPWREASWEEAIAFAVLAYESWHKRPANLPSATGAKRRVILGKISHAPRAL